MAAKGHGQSYQILAQGKQIKSSYQKVSEYDQEIPHSINAAKPMHREEESQNTNCHKTSGRQLKLSNQAATGFS